MTTREKLIGLRKHMIKWVPEEKSAINTLTETLIEHPTMLGVTGSRTGLNVRYELLSEGHGAFGEPDNTYLDYIFIGGVKRYISSDSYFVIGPDGVLDVISFNPDFWLRKCIEKFEEESEATKEKMLKEFGS